MGSRGVTLRRARDHGLRFRNEHLGVPFFLTLRRCSVPTMALPGCAFKVGLRGRGRMASASAPSGMHVHGGHGSLPANVPLPGPQAARALH